MSYAFPEKLDKQVFALLPASLEERLKRYCLREHRSQSQAIRIMIACVLDAEVVPAPEGKARPKPTSIPPGE